MTTLIPSNFAQTILDVFNERGRLWLDNLPNLIAHCEQRWAITIAPPFALTYNYVAPAHRADGTPLVFKAGLPESTVANEMEALRHWAGHGAVALLDSDPAAGVMLLESLQPGTPLVEMEDDEAATHIFAQVTRQLWRPLPPNHKFDSVHRLAKGLSRLRTRYNGQTGPLPNALVETAESLFTDLLASQAESVLLHGDLHHWNILSATRQPWLAIDPQGMAGEPCYEVGAWLRNPLPGLFNKPNPERLLARRIDILSDSLGFDRQRIIDWGLAQAVLSAWWSIEDHGEAHDGWHAAIRVAEIFGESKIMTETEIVVSTRPNSARVIRAVEKAANEQALTLALKGTLRKYPGCVHWHFKKDQETGTLEITWWPAQRRLWIKVALNRQNPWINEVIPHLKQSLEANL